MSTYDFIEQQGVGAGFVYKTTTAAYYFNGTTFSQITDADYPATTVRGIAYLDGTYYVMTPSGAIHGSDLENISSWSALNVIQSRMEPDGGVCLARQLNFIVAFSAYSTEFFYDAGNATGSPLLPYASGFLEIGCAVAESVAQTENSIYFIGTSKKRGRSVYKLVGVEASIVSTPFVDRILMADPLTSVTSYCIDLNGHKFYVLYLGGVGKTLVFDSTTGHWAEWTQTALSATKTVSAASWSNGLVTATVTAHGFNDGDVLVLDNITPIGYNGTYTANVVDANTITYPVATTLTPLTVAGTAANYVEGPFNMASYCKAGNFDLVQDSTTGTVYAVDTGVYTDNGAPIEFRVRTQLVDGGDNKMKFFNRAEVVGDKVASTAYLRYTNDDYQTWSAFRPVDLSLARSLLNRLGRGRRRAFELRHHDAVPLRVEALELDVDKGVN